MNTHEWLAKLISFDTTSRHSNLPLIACVANWFADHGIASQWIYSSDKQKANLVATLPAHDGKIQGGVILFGHTDVVPVDGQQWDSDPFVALQKNDRIYGRGSCDMKGFIAVVLALVPYFKQYPLQKPIHYVFSYDEEVGCIGATSIIQDIQQRGLQPEGCIVGEPTDMFPIIGHKGVNAYRCQVHGFATHSSLAPEGCNAIEYAAKFIHYLCELADQLRDQGPRDENYDVPFSSLSTNLITGGNAINTIPSFREFIYEFRNLPFVSPGKIQDEIHHYLNQTLLPLMRLEYSKGKIGIEQLASAPGFSASENSPFIQWIRALTQDNKIRKVAYATEAGLFQQAGIPTIVCGPGNIEQAHRANEYVRVEQLKKCEDFLLKLVQFDMNGQR